MAVMASLKPKEKQFLFTLARQAINQGLEGEFKLPVITDIPYRSLKVDQATFVTLTINSQLRGCIGHLEAIQSLYLDVYENASAAAFKDYRFNPVTRPEFSQLNIEISILSAPVPIKAKTPDEKLKAITPHAHGLILELQGRRSTFLPQVWEDLPIKEEFLAHLSQKALLTSDAWQNPQAKLSTYTVKILRE